MRTGISLIVVLISTVTQAQTLFSEGFEGTPAFTLNTTDAASTSGITNAWVVNSVFAGGNGVADCLGFPLDFSIGATPGQPAAITDPNGAYLHTASLVAVQNGINCCSFGAADGFCTNADDVFARMTVDVSTVGVSEVSLKFWWLCNGGNQNYGEVWYSTNGGTGWAMLTTPIAQYRNQGTWVEQTITDAAFADQATLRFGFRFHNGESLLGGSDPGFAVDDVRIEGSSTASIITAISISSYCEGASFGLNYQATGSFSAGNVFTAQLSDASGAFGNPIVIGSLLSTTSGVIPVMIPNGVPAGAAYRIRVVSSAPVVTGADNGTDITINPLPQAGPDQSVSFCPGEPAGLLIIGAQAGSSWSGPSIVVDNLYDPLTMEPGTYVYSVTNSCGTDYADFTVNEPAGAYAGLDSTVVVCANWSVLQLIGLLGGQPQAGGGWTGPDGEPHGPDLDPGVDVTGSYTYTVVAADPCPQDQAVVEVTVDACMGLDQTDVEPRPLRWMAGGADGFALFQGDLEPTDRVLITAPDGKAVRTSTQLRKGALLVGTSGLAPGCYLLTVLRGDVRRVVRWLK